MNQEQMIEMQMIEQESSHLNQQMQIIEQNINEMNEIHASLNELENHDDCEMLVNIGKKIYLPVENKVKKLIVEVGRGNLIEKNIPETKKIVEEQLIKLNHARIQLNEKLNELQEKIIKVINDFEKNQKED